MKKHHLTYRLFDGYIEDWLALGPCDVPVQEAVQPGESDVAFRQRVLRSLDHTTLDVAKSPVELDTFACGKETLFWEAEHTLPDHQLDWSDSFPVYTHRRAWAFTSLSCPNTNAATVHLTVTCPASIWLNGRHVQYFEHAGLHSQTPATYSFTINLKHGRNDLLVRLEQVAVGDAALAMAVRLDGLPLAEAKVWVPTVTEQPERRLEWERAFEHTHMDRGFYARDDQVGLICEDDMESWHEGVVRIQKPDGRIYSESFTTFKAKETLEGLYGMQLPSGALQAVMMSQPGMYYQANFRPRRRLSFWVSAYRDAVEPGTAYEDRLLVAMQEAERSGDALYSEIVKMALGWWNVVDKAAIRQTIERIKRCDADVLPDLLGLLGMRQRMARYEQFPADLLPEIDACALGFDYSAAAHPQLDMTMEARLLLSASQILAGQLYPKETFAVSGLTGRQMRKRGEDLAAAWLKAFGQTGAGAWSMQTELLVTALAHLAALAKSDVIQEMSAVLLDKVFFGLATHSLRGAYGASRGYARPGWVRSARFAPESALMRLLWGMGGYSDAFKAVVSLVLAGNGYELPEIIRTVALDASPEMWQRQRQRGADGADVYTVTYKTPDYLLSSAQDYRPGQRGAYEHIWQATMGLDALVFTNHPTSFSEKDSRQAGWWRGNGSLPRVAQWKDTLVALYDLKAEDGLGFTHAHFPTYAFDEHMLEQGWAFARKGDGYLALYGGPAMQLTSKGLGANHELRLAGPYGVWLCQMGRMEVDSSFEDFRAHVLAKRPVIDGLQVTWETVRGQTLRFDWTGPLSVDGEAQDLASFRHVESPFAVAEMPAESMDIVYGQDVMRLSFT